MLPQPRREFGIRSVLGTWGRLGVAVAVAAIVALFVIVRVKPSLIVRSPMFDRTGGLLTSLTCTVKVFASFMDGEPSSLTRAVIE